MMRQPSFYKTHPRFVIVVAGTDHKVISIGGLVSSVKPDAMTNQFFFSCGQIQKCHHATRSPGSGIENRIAFSLPA